MTFNSLTFAAFFVAVFVLYYRFGVRGQNRLMVIAGWIFYGAFDWRFLGLLWLSTIVDYFVGRGLASTSEEGRRKLLLATSITVQIGILATFKYLDFFIDSAEKFLRHVGIVADSPLLNVAVPVGISFYTFQTLAYVFAVYRHEIEAEKDPVTFAAFVAWFPQLAAGPIERVNSLLPQIQVRRTLPTPAVMESGLILILRGLFKKMVLADGVAPIVNAVYATPAAYGWKSVVLASVGFAIQVYGDFSGYSDIARGTSRLLGVELRWNFEQPFLSRDMREFWNRWHTSLGWWFTEHVARPLGGAGGSRLRGAFITMIVFALIGLWHGPASSFVAWGIYNGVLVVIWRNLPTPTRRHPMRIQWPDLPRIALTFGLFCLGGLLFRASSIHVARGMLGQVVHHQAGQPPPRNWLLVPILLVIMFALDLLDRHRRIVAIETTRTRARLGGVATPGEAVLESPVAGMRPFGAGLFVAVLLIGVIIFSGQPPAPFIYFQF